MTMKRLFTWLRSRLKPLVKSSAPQEGRDGWHRFFRDENDPNIVYVVVPASNKRLGDL